MYRRILVPVDLAHLDKLDKALDTAAKIAAGDGATIIYTGVTTSEPSAVAHSPQEFAAKLDAFAAEEGGRRGVTAEAHAMRSHDPAVDLADRLLDAVKETRADLVVMASHVPGVKDHIFHSNSGHVSAHAPVSVFVVR
jgi:nucleotide-binding universal stress UspA family protein